MSRKPSTDATTRTTPDTKRPYVRPVLKRYGDLAQLTQSKRPTGTQPDGVLANNNKSL